MGLIKHKPVVGENQQPLSAKEAAGTFELLKQSFQYAFDTTTSHAPLHNTEMFSMRNQEVQDRIADGTVPKNISQTFGTDYNLIARYLNEEKGFNIPSDIDLKKEQGKMIRERGEDLARLQEGATTGQKIIGGAGFMAGAMMDVDVAAGMFIGGASAVYKGLRAAKAFRRGLAVGAALELPRQISVWEYKTARDIDTNAKEVIFNIAFAAFGEAAAIGLIAKLSSLKTAKAVDEIVKRHGDEMSPDALHQAANTKRLMESEVTEDAEELLSTIQRKSDDYELHTPIESRELDNLAARQDASRLKELQGKKKLTELEADELEILTDQQRFTRTVTEVTDKKGKTTTTVKETKGATTHPADDFKHINDADRQWLKGRGAEIVDEAENLDSLAEQVADCLIGNGVKI